jgi:tetratricopeptide (TPR) repeat protein
MKAFATSVGMKSPKSVQNWINDRKCPPDLSLIERALFGGNGRYSAWKKALQEAHQTAKARASSDVEEGIEAPDASTEAPGDGASTAQILHPDIRPVPSFTGREDLLKAIGDALAAKGKTAALTQAVRGLGGVGKSVLAREWAWLNREKYHGVWWVRAEQADSTLQDDLIELGSQLIPDLKNADKYPTRADAVRKTLETIEQGTADKPWLIVYDNVEKPSAIAKLTPRERAHILITSRWPRWQNHAQELPVDVFPPETAMDFLLAERPHETREAAARLAEALGYLPLALSHARAYCAFSNVSFASYMKRLPELIKKAPQDTDYPESVFATFSLAMEKAAESCPQAEKLMGIAAFLEAEHIPLGIITGDVMSESERDDAVAALSAVSLLTCGTSENSAETVTVHRLVQEVMRGRLGGQRLTIQQIALRLMHNALDAVEVREHVNWPHIAALLPHAIAVLAPLDQRDEVEAGGICSLLDIYFDARGDYPQAETYSTQALAIAEAAQGKDHPTTGARLNNLAELYRSQGRYGEAEPLYLRALAIFEKRLGSDHPSTRTVRGNYEHLRQAMTADL